MSQRAIPIRLMLLALAGVLLLLGAFVVVFAGTASTASADEYGGLGSLAELKAGKNAAHLEVNPRGIMHSV